MDERTERMLREAADKIAPTWDEDRAKRVRQAMAARKRARARMRSAASAVAAIMAMTLFGSGRWAQATEALRRLWARVVVSSVGDAPTEEPSASAAPVDPLRPAGRASPKPDPAPVVDPPSVIASDTPGGASAEAPSATAPAPVTTPRVAASAAHKAPASDWRSLAREQDFNAAYAAIRATPSDVKDEAEDLLLASDVARLSKHPDEAVAPLQKIIGDHSSDARAPLAAFTLGRVLLDLKRPADAADAFAKARALDHTGRGSLAEDALAREVEAASLSGDAARARARAEEYLRDYPNGVRAAVVRRLGGAQ